MRICQALCVTCLLVAGFGLTAFAQAEPAPAEAAPAVEPAAPMPPLTVAVLGFAAGNTLPDDMGQNLSALLVAT